MSQPGAHHRRAGALGGRATAATSPAKRRALDVLHASRRGHRQHPGGGTAGASLARLYRAGLRRSGHRQTNPFSQRRLACLLGVSGRTIGRWLRGLDYPSPAHASAIVRLVQAQSVRR